MKHLNRLVVSGLVVLSASAYSCKKDYTCQCDSVNTDPNANSIKETYIITYSSVTRRTAKSLCVSYQETKTTGGSSATSRTDCKLQ